LIEKIKVAWAGDLTLEKFYKKYATEDNVRFFLVVETWNLKNDAIDDLTDSEPKLIAKEEELPAPPEPVEELKFSNLLDIEDNSIENISDMDSYRFEKPEPFRLELEGINESKNLYLAASDNLSCEKIARFLNDGKKEDKSGVSGSVGNWWDRVKSGFSSGWSDIKDGQWAMGGGKITGVLLGQTLAGVIKFGVGTVKGVVVAGGEAIKTTYAEVTGDTATGTNDSKQGYTTIRITASATSDVFQLPDEVDIGGLLYVVDHKEVDGKTKWEIKKIKVNEETTVKVEKDYKGTVKFTACQFDLSGGQLDSKDELSDSIEITFGPEVTPECHSIDECKARIDEKFVKDIFKD